MGMTGNLTLTSLRKKSVLIEKLTGYIEFRYSLIQEFIKYLYFSVPSFFPHVDIAFRLHVGNQDVGSILRPKFFQLRVHGEQRKHFSLLASETECSRIYSDGNKRELCTYP